MQPDRPFWKEIVRCIALTMCVNERQSTGGLPGASFASRASQAPSPKTNKEVLTWLSKSSVTLAVSNVQRNRYATKERFELEVMP
jgi:hypothetical protein